MDVLKPETIWVDGKCYRKTPNKIAYDIEITRTNPGTSGENWKSEASGGGYIEEDLYADEICGDEREIGDDGYILEQTENGFKTFCDNIPRDLFSVIIGRQGSTKIKLESETKTKIIVPARDRPDGCISIRGISRQNVIACRRRIDDIAFGARIRKDPTHFVCFPLNVPSVMNKFEEFKTSVLEECANEGIEESIFQEKEKFHLTLCVLILLDENERSFIKRDLEDSQAYINSIVNGEKLEVHLKGLEIMNDDPSKVDVLYAKCLMKNDKLQNLADSVVKRLNATGLMKPNHSDKVKFHMTLMNSIFRNESTNAGTDRGDRRWNKKQPFDAQQILKKFGDFDFGKVEIKEIQIAIRKTNAANGFYSLTAKIPI